MCTLIAFECNWIGVPLSIFMLSGMCADCLLVHGAVADKKILVHPESKIAVLFLLPLKELGYSPKIMQIDLTYDL
jgi:hypothetical protein